jgi:hypothetical protein
MGKVIEILKLILIGLLAFVIASFVIAAAREQPTEPTIEFGATYERA